MTCDARFNRTFSSLFVILGAVAGQSATARADEIQVPYNLAAGATTAPILIPASDTPISLTCTQNAAGFRGVGQATLLKTPSTSPPAFLEWVGMDVATTAVTSGFSSSAGTHIIYCDFTGKSVDLQVQGAAAIQVKNTSGEQAFGVITLVW